MITVKGLEKAFGKLRVLKGVDLSLSPGEVTALVGPNGSGKTTLIKIILGLCRPDAGRITFGGTSLSGGWAYRDQVGYMPQTPPLPENLAAAELFQMLTDLRGSHDGPDQELMESFDLNGQMTSPLRTLSGGTRQKVNAVMAFMFQPEVFILDEPTAGLDPLASRHLKARIVRERNAGKSILITSHILSELQELADRVVFLLEGRTRFSGSFRKLRELTSQATLEGAVAELMKEDEGP